MQAFLIAYCVLFHYFCGKKRYLYGKRKRNEALCRRYYFWTEVQGLRFDRALKILSEQEFFISEERIMAIIRECSKTDPDIRPVPKVRAPRLTYRQLALFSDDAGYPVAQIRRES